MEQSFCVTASGNPVGKVTVCRQGLYYRFCCRCHLSGDILYRLMVICGSVRENLGVLVPRDDCFLLDKKVAVKRIGEGDMSFVLFSSGGQSRETFVPIFPEEPFSYISRLKKAFLVYQNGQMGLCIDETQE